MLEEDLEKVEARIAELDAAGRELVGYIQSLGFEWHIKCDDAEEGSMTHWDQCLCCEHTASEGHDPACDLGNALALFLHGEKQLADYVGRKPTSQIGAAEAEGVALRELVREVVDHMHEADAEHCELQLEGEGLWLSRAESILSGQAEAPATAGEG